MGQPSDGNHHEAQTIITRRYPGLPCPIEGPNPRALRRSDHSGTSGRTKTSARAASPLVAMTGVSSRPFVNPGEWNPVGLGASRR